MSKFLNEILLEDSPPEDFKPSPFVPGANLARRLENHYDELLKNPHRIAIRHHSNKSENLNHYLWERHKNPLHHAMDANKEEDAAHLDNVVHHKTTPEDMTVYSKVEYDPTKHMNSEGIVHHPAFMSTSISKDYAKGFRAHRDDHHVLAIHLPKGSPGGYIGHVSDFPEEQEHLLPRGMNLKIHRSEVERHSRTDYHGNDLKSGRIINYHIHHATIESHHEPSEE